MAHDGSEQPEPVPDSPAGEAGGPLDPASRALAERIKELNCLYGISNLFENQDVSLTWIMERAVELIPAAWQYPENACARICLEGREYTSRNFRRTSWCQSAPIVLNGRRVGDVAVFYLEAPPRSAGGPFLEEEARLLKVIGERLSKVLWLKRSEEALKESEARYRILTEQVAEGVALVQDNRFRYVNPEFCRMFDIPSPQAVTGAPVNRLPAGEADEIAGLYSDAGEGSTGETVQKVHRIARPQKTMWIAVSHSPISFKGQAALMSTFKDVTEIKEQQLSAERAADQLHCENRMLRSSLKERYRLGNIIGRSRAMREVYELILKAAGTDASVAIYGESGTGKELVALAIHENGLRREKGFVAVNCGAVQESLFEREFFGHRKGAFSSAHADSPGYLDMADGGTLFLDEIGELTLTMQAKLLRAIEGGGYRPVGGTRTLFSDFRILSASNTDLRRKVRMGEMRDDFFYRVQVIQIELPPLRDRREDIPLLVEHFLREMKGPGIERVPGRVMDTLIEHAWPGNVRELKNVLQRYATLGELEFLSPAPGGDEVPGASGLDLQKSLKRLEASMISSALAQTGGNRSRAAALLGISRRALFRKMSSR